MLILRLIAIVQLSSLVVAFPVRASSISDYERGAAAFQRKDFVASIASFENALAKTPENPNVNYGLAAAFTAAGNSFQARHFYEQCILLAPKSTIAQNARLGLAYLDQRAALASNAANTSRSAANLAASMNGPIALTGRVPDGYSFVNKRTRSPYEAAIDSGNTPLPEPVVGKYYQPDDQFRQPLSNYHYPPIVSTSGSGPNSFGYGGGGGYGYQHHHHMHQRGQYSLAYGANGMNGQGSFRSYGPSYLSYYSAHVPVLVVKNYSFPGSPSSALGFNSSEQTPMVELLAKQEKLVIDEKPSN